jgi:hypothetical protein
MIQSWSKNLNIGRNGRIGAFYNSDNPKILNAGPYGASDLPNFSKLKIRSLTTSNPKRFVRAYSGAPPSEVKLYTAQHNYSTQFLLEPQTYNGRDNIYSLRNGYFGNLACSDTTASSLVTTTANRRNWNSQKWEITPLGRGQYTIKNMASNLYLRALYNGSNWTNGNDIGVSYWRNVNSIKWAFDYIDN